MPELPDITVYIESLTARILGSPLERLRLASPFFLRSVNPSVREIEGKRVLGLRRIGKHIVFALEDDLFVIIHLMIAGRLHWKERGAKIPARVGLAALDFPTGTLIVTEASTRKRASLHLTRGEAALAQFDRGGLEVFDADLAAFKTTLQRERHTVKRALTDPTLFSGIGNAYSDEILFHARLSPAALTTKLDDAEIERLYAATHETLKDWIERLREDAGAGFPEKVTAFRKGMAVHGRYRRPCLVCGAPIQRIAYADNETNYCARCQTGGRLLSDRSLSVLLRGDWPKTLEELETRMPQRAAGRQRPVGRRPSSIHR